MSAVNGMCDYLNVGSWHELEIKLTQAGCYGSFLKQAIHSKDNKLAKAMFAGLAQGIFNEIFKKTNHEYIIRTEEDYVTHVALRSFTNKYKKKNELMDIRGREFYDAAYLNHDIRFDAEYEIKLLQLVSPYMLRDMLVIMQLNGYSLLSARGLCLLWEQYHEQLPKNSSIHCFDSYKNPNKQGEPKLTDEYNYLELFFYRDVRPHGKWVLRSKHFALENDLDPQMYESSIPGVVHYVPVYKRINYML